MYGLVSYAYLAAVRVGSAVYVNGLVHQKTSAGQLIDSAGRTVVLQRLVNGHWANVLTRTTGSRGQVSVGFQSKACQYRWFVLEVGGSPWAKATSWTTSGSAVR